MRIFRCEICEVCEIRQSLQRIPIRFEVLNRTVNTAAGKHHEMHNMKQHSADGCAAPGRGASDTTWPTLQRRTRFGDDHNMVMATQRRAQREYDGRATVVRATRCGRRFPGGMRFRDDQNTVLGDAAASATGGRPECSSEPRSTGAMRSRGRRARSLTPPCWPVRF